LIQRGEQEGEGRIVGAYMKKRFPQLTIIVQGDVARDDEVKIDRPWHRERQEIS
jgi:hypothetical protein